MGQNMQLRLNQGFEFGELSLFEDDDSEKSQDQKFEDTEIITATLHPGICTDGKSLEDDPIFSMLGTNRIITEFSLRIYSIDDDKEHCSIWGGVSYTAEVDFRNDTSPDTIEIHLGITKDRFNKLAGIISNKSVDVARIGISRISGFYSDWSPSISTNSVKILARGSEQEISKPDECDIEPPRLGEVGKFDFSLTTRCKLNPKQNFETLNISKLFEDDFEIYEEDNEVEEQDNVFNTLVSQIAHNQTEIIKIKKPLWLLVILLTLPLLSIRL